MKLIASTDSDINMFLRQLMRFYTSLTIQQLRTKLLPVQACSPTDGFVYKYKFSIWIKPQLP